MANSPKVPRVSNCGWIPCLFRTPKQATLFLGPNFDGKTRWVLYSASRHRYRQGNPDAMQLPEEKYKATGEVLEGGWLVFVDHKGRQTRWPLGVPEQRPNLYARDLQVALQLLAE